MHFLIQFYRRSTGKIISIVREYFNRVAFKLYHMRTPSLMLICHRGGVRLESLKHSWRKACERVGLGKMVEDPESRNFIWVGPIPHDFRRTAVRNMVRAGIPEEVAMAISGHKTRSVFDRYNIVNETDLARAAQSLSTYFEQEKNKSVGTLAGTLTESPLLPTHEETTELVGIAEGGLELARGIEPSNRRRSTLKPVSRLLQRGPAPSQAPHEGDTSPSKPLVGGPLLVELARGIEPPTCGLQNRCSAD